MNYTVLLESKAQKEIRALPAQVLIRVDALLQRLAVDPRPRGALRLQGKQAQGWRVRLGDYRILYTIEDAEKHVRVYRIKHRREVYR